ncbi:MAG: SUMF1/EgtB/PvdO family nonheme iron enzyme [Bacteroidota bacterium]
MKHPHQLADVLCLSNLERHMVSIKGGEFLMGGERYDNEQPIHKVKLDDYELCRYPVSQQLWLDVMEAYPEELYFQNPHRPVEDVSWDDIQTNFLPALREKTRDNSWCLPTEAQWEYAARGGNYARAYTYAGSEQLKEVGWYDDNSLSETSPIAYKRPNSLGLYDMSGNVFEWCQDKYDSSYYQTLKDQYGNQPAANPGGPKAGSSRVVRGGSWDDDPASARVSNRDVGTPYYRYIVVGFRLCRYSAR